jgi:hypothetical protein
LPVLQRVVAGEAVDGTDREPCFPREPGLVGAFGRGLGESFVGNERSRLGVPQDVADLGAGEVIVDRDEVPTGL